jgi:hypothetical protein
VGSAKAGGVMTQTEFSAQLSDLLGRARTDLTTEQVVDELEMQIEILRDDIIEEQDK